MRSLNEEIYNYVQDKDWEGNTLNIPIEEFNDLMSVITCNGRIYWETKSSCCSVLLLYLYLLWENVNRKD